jgi:CHAD domain-containing protein
MKRGPAPDIGVAFLATYKKARKRLDHGFASRNAEDLHTARKHVIHHIHHLDLLRSNLTSPAKRLASLDKLREALGDLNDLDELCQLSSGLTARLPEAADRVMAKRRATLLKRAEKAAGRLFRDKPKAYGRRTVGMWVAHDR